MNDIILSVFLIVGAIFFTATLIYVNRQKQIQGLEGLKLRSIELLAKIDTIIDEEVVQE